MSFFTITKAFLLHGMRVKAVALLNASHLLHRMRVKAVTLLNASRSI